MPKTRCPAPDPHTSVGAMTIRTVRSGREGADRTIETLRGWAPRHGYVDGLHMGDVGWHRRFDDADLAGTVVEVVDDDGVLLACGLAEVGSFRTAIDPLLVDDSAVASALADVADDLAEQNATWCDATYQSAYRAELARRGWRIEPDTWCIFYRALTAADGEADDPHCLTLSTEEDIADRVAVQRSAFAKSTFTVQRWRQMAAGPGYDPALEYLRRDESGVAVSAAIGWSAGPGRVAILEPVATHRDHGRAGHGVAVCRSVIAALARAGASGVVVATPSSNTAAVATYPRCGMPVIQQLQSMTRGAPDR